MYLVKVKKKLSEKVIELTKKIPLTDIEKKTFLGLISFPMLNDRQLTKQINIKRSILNNNPYLNLIYMFSLYYLK